MDHCTKKIQQLEAEFGTRHASFVVAVAQTRHVIGMLIENGAPEALMDALATATATLATQAQDALTAANPDVNEATLIAQATALMDDDTEL